MTFCAPSRAAARAVVLHPTLWRALGTELLVDEVLPWAVDAEFRKQSSSTLALVKSSSRWLFFSYSRTHPIHI